MAKSISGAQASEKGTWLSPRTNWNPPTLGQKITAQLRLTQSQSATLLKESSASHYPPHKQQAANREVIYPTVQLRAPCGPPSTRSSAWTQTKSFLTQIWIVAHWHLLDKTSVSSRICSPLVVFPLLWAHVGSCNYFFISSFRTIAVGVSLLPIILCRSY